MPLTELFTIVCERLLLRSIPTTDDSGTKLLIFGSMLIYSSEWVISSRKPGPSKEYISLTQFLSSGFAKAEAYIARLPPLECPPILSGGEVSLKFSLRYFTLYICPAVCWRYAIAKSSFQPTTEPSVPLNEIKRVPSPTVTVKAENCTSSSVSMILT